MCSGAIHGLACAQLASGLAFLALGGQCIIAHIDAASGAVQDRWEAGKHALTAMAASQDGSRCVLAGASVDMWDQATKARVFRFSGHAVRRAMSDKALVVVGQLSYQLRRHRVELHRISSQTPAKVAACTNDGTLAASAGSGERTLAVWDASGPPSKKRRAAAGLDAVSRPPLVQISGFPIGICRKQNRSSVAWLPGLLETESPVVALKMHGLAMGAALVAAALEDGGALVWRYEAAAQEAQLSKNSARLRVRGTGSVFPTLARMLRIQHSGQYLHKLTPYGSCDARVVAVALDVGLDGAASLLVTRGGARPAFERFAVPAAGLPRAEVVIGSTQVRTRP